MTRSVRAAAPLVGLIVLVLLFGAVALGGVGMLGRSGGTDASEDPEPVPSTRPAVAPTTTVPLARPEMEGPTVRIVAQDADQETFPPLVPAIGGLEPDTVVSLVVADFPEFATARARQCTIGVPVRCGNPIGVQFSVDGVASFQYLVHRDFARADGGDACGPRAPACTIVVENIDGEGRAEVQTVFGGEVPPAGALEIEPRTGLRDGQLVGVRVTGQPAGAELEVVVCAAPAVTGRARCGGPRATAVVGRDGTATTSLRITEGPLGTEAVFCRRGRQCAVVVRSATAVVRTPPVRFAFAAPPGAGYEGWRLGAGLGAAALLLVGAVWFVRRTDWAPVGEVAAPEIDEAAYADLDAIVAALPPEEVEEAAPRR